MSFVSTTTTATPADETAARSSGVPVAILGMIALAPALFSVSRVNILETQAAGGMLALVALFFILQKRLSAGTAGIALAVLFVATLLNLSPLSLRSTLQQGWTGPSALRWVALSVPFVCALLMALMMPQSGVGEGRIAASIGSVSVRFNLWLISCMALIGGLMLCGYSIQSIASLALLLAAGTFALRPILLLVKQPRAATALAGAMALVLLVNLIGGAMAYAEVSTALERGRVAAAAKNDAEAQNFLNEAARLNERVQSREKSIGILRELGALDEQFGRFDSAVFHWRQVVDLTNVDFLTHPAIRRILVRQGDSLLGWRQLVQKGFPSVMSDELIPGFMALAERPDADVRGTLLAALVRWEHGDAEAERRASLEKVLKRRANEVSANTLMSVLGRPLPKDALWLGGDLIVGDRTTEGSVSGTIRELGSVDSLVFLTEGRWECRVKARGTPLNEEWPVLRVELDGNEALRARVNKVDAMELPFTFDVKARNLFRIHFVFENQLNLFQGNQQAHRGLDIEGVYFMRAGP